MLACQSRGFRLTGQRHCDKLHNAVPGGNASQPLSQSDQAIQDAGRESLSKEEYVKRQRRLWYLAIKPPMYSVCIIPVLVRQCMCFSLWKLSLTTSLNRSIISSLFSFGLMRHIKKFLSLVWMTPKMRDCSEGLFFKGTEWLESSPAWSARKAGGEFWSWH